MQKILTNGLFFITMKAHIAEDIVLVKRPCKLLVIAEELAQAKNVTNLFAQHNNFIVSDKAEAGSAGKQPARNSLTDGNDKAVEQNPTAFTESFLSHMP